jgi:hypothetical protein
MEMRDCASYKTFYTLHRFITDAFITLNNSQFQKSFGVYILALFSKLDHYINVKKILIKKLFGVNLLTLLLFHARKQFARIRILSAVEILPFL